MPDRKRDDGRERRRGDRDWRRRKDDDPGRRSSSKGDAAEKRSDGRGRDDEERLLLEKARRYVEEHEEHGGGNQWKRRSVEDKSSSSRRDADGSEDRDRDRHGVHRRRGDEDRDRSSRKTRERIRSQSRDRGNDHRKERRHGEKKREEERKSSRNDDRRGGKGRNRNDSGDRKKDRKISKEGRHRDGDDCDRRKKKRNKHDKKDASKKSKGGSGSGGGSDRKAPRGEKIDKASLYPLGSPPPSPPADTIDHEADYFAFHPHLRLYLYRERGTRFEDLTSSQTRKAFADFVKRYNAGTLEVGYYDPGGPPAEALEECGRTRHAWDFRTNEVERRSLDVVKAGVKKQTDYDNKAGEASAKTAVSSSRPVGPVASPAAAATSAGRPGVEPRRQERKTPEEVLADRAAHRRLRDHVKTAEEEMRGGRSDPGSRERALEKRRERSAATHGAARDREDAGVELGDAAVYGDGGKNSYREALARERTRKAAREGKKAARVEELKKKEEDKQTAMLKMLGLQGIQPGQKITIAPRKDG